MRFTGLNANHSTFVVIRPYSRNYFDVELWGKVGARSKRLSSEVKRDYLAAVDRAFALSNVVYKSLPGGGGFVEVER